MKIPPWNFSLWGAGLDPNSSRSWTDPPRRPPPKGSMKPPRPPPTYHGATKGIPARGKKKRLKTTKTSWKNPKSPEIATSPSEIKNKGGGERGEVPPAWTPPPWGTWGRGKNPVLQVGTWERRYRGGWGGFGIELDCVSRRCGWIFFFWGGGWKVVGNGKNKNKLRLWGLK